MHSRFLKVAGVAILAVALFTLDGALKLGGAPVSSAQVKTVVFQPEASAMSSIAADGVQEARISAGAGGYSPGRVQIRSGRPARIVFTGDGTAGCALALVFEGESYLLKTGGETTIELPPQKPGAIEYTCSMGMYGGRIEIV